MPEVAGKHYPYTKKGKAASKKAKKKKNNPNYNISKNIGYQGGLPSRSPHTPYKQGHIEIKQGLKYK